MFANLKTGTRLAVAYAVSEAVRASERSLLFVKLDSQKLAT